MLDLPLERDVPQDRRRAARVTILGVSGSLRAASKNTTVLAGLVGVTLFEGLRGLPAFDPDREEADAPLVAHWREAIEGADAVLFCSPEYAHGLPGALKNALDHLVGSGEFSGKPVGVLNISPHSRFAHVQLEEVLRTMDARVIPEACATILPTQEKDLARLVVILAASPRTRSD